MRRSASALSTTLRRLFESANARWIVLVPTFIIAGLAVWTVVADRSWTLATELSALLIAGVGGLMMHELAHAFAHELALPGRPWEFATRGVSLAIVTEDPVVGLNRVAVAAAGPIVGAVVSALPMLFSNNDGVFVLLALIHLFLLTPLASDGRHIVDGLRQARLQSSTS